MRLKTVFLELIQYLLINNTVREAIIVLRLSIAIVVIDVPLKVLIYLYGNVFSQITFNNHQAHLHFFIFSAISGLLSTVIFTFHLLISFFNCPKALRPVCFVVGFSMIYALVVALLPVMTYGIGVGKVKVGGELMDNFKQLQNGYSNLRSANITDGYVNLTEAELMRFMRAQSQVGRLQHQLKCCGPDEKSYWSNLKLNGTQLRFSWIGMQLNWEGKCELLAKTMGRPNCGKRLVSVAFAAMWIQSILLVISAFFHVFLLSGAIDERVERTPIEVKLF